MKIVYVKTLSGDLYTIDNAPELLDDLFHLVREVLPEPKPDPVDMKLFREEDVDKKDETSEYITHFELGEPELVVAGALYHLLVLESNFYVEIKYLCDAYTETDDSWEKWRLSIVRTCNEDRVYLIDYYYNTVSQKILSEGDLEFAGQVSASQWANNDNVIPIMIRRGVSPMSCLSFLFKDFPVVRLRKTLAELAHIEMVHNHRANPYHDFNDDWELLE